MGCCMFPVSSGFDPKNLGQVRDKKPAPRSEHEVQLPLRSSLNVTSARISMLSTLRMISPCGFWAVEETDQMGHGKHKAKGGAQTPNFTLHTLDATELDSLIALA